MKKIFICMLFAVAVLQNNANGQNIAINTDGSLPDASAMIDIASTTKGFLAPRMTSIQQSAISLPAKGLLIYNTTDNTFKVNTGTAASPVWTTLGASSNSWLLTGNSGSNAATNFLGTTDNINLSFRTNNLQRMLIDNQGKIGIGTSTFNATNPEKLVVDAGVTTSVNAIVGKGSINSYLQLNIQNQSSGTSASSDVVATANNGDESNNYVDMGINGGSYSGGVMGAANDGYLYTMGNNFLIGTGNISKSLIFMTGGTSQSSNERMRIDGTGNVGIGVTSPAYKLQVNAASNPLYLAGVQTGAGTDSLMTILNGVVRRIAPSALSNSSAWGVTGNASTNPSTNFIGTTDAQALVIKENNTQVGRFEANSIALGNGATTNTATNSYAFGSGAIVAYGKTSAMAIGKDAQVNADNSTSIGAGAITNGSGSFAIGNGAIANNANSLAMGNAAVTAFSISDAIAIGSSSTANSNNAIVIGKNATTGFSITNPIAIGLNASVSGSNGIAVGNGTNISTVSNATVIGAGSTASSTATNSTAIGYNTDITKANEIILGDMSNSALSVGVGSENFSTSNREKLLVDAGATTSVNAIVGKGSINSYLQLNIQNQSSGTSASSDVVATANNGDEISNYVDMGINGGSYSGGVMGAANDGYLYTMGNNFLIGTGNVAKSVVFMTGGTSQASNERMRIDGTGNVGIGNILPTQKLDITGNLRLSGAFMPGNDAGTAGYILQSLGSGVAPHWIDASPYLTTLTWMQGGNSVGSIKTIGTTSNFDLPFITNNAEKMRISTAGDVAIGSTSFNATNPEQLLVNSGTTTSVNSIVGKGSINSYLQLNIQNQSTGTSASSDVVATANNGDETTNYVDMGINGGSYSGGIMGGANDSYLYNMGQNFLIGTGSAAKSLVFMTGGTSQATNERMRIDGTGNVGIGATAFNATNPEQLLVDAGTTTSVNAIVGKGNINSYLQLNIQNQSNGSSASSDVVATANNGNETSNYVDMGINGGSYTGGVMGAANDGYLYTMGNNFLIGTANTSKALIFMTGGTSQASNERMRIDGSGNVGIGTTSLNSTFTVAGSQSVSYKSGAAAQSLTAADYVVINTGGSIPTWTLPLASSCAGRIYRLINHGTSSVTLSQAVTTANGTTTTTLANAAGSNTYEIISDGTVWRKMD